MPSRKGPLSWRSYESIRERAQTFFTNQDLRSNLPTSSRNGSIPARGKAKDLLCREWNYTGKCSCAISDASYKAVHRCRVCDSPDHAMLTCAKRKYPIPASQSASSSTSSSTGADQSSWLRSLVVLSNEVRAFGLPNFLGAKRLVHSRFNVDVWSHYLEHYQDRVIIDFLRYGWPINYQSDVLASSSFHNHPSAVKNSSYLSTYIAKELFYQSVFGPFHCNPFNADALFLRYSVHQSVTLSSYVIHNFSSPEGLSVNDGISSDHYLEQFFKLRLPGIDRLVEFVNAKGRGCHVFKKDLWRAYRQIPIDPQDYPLLGLYIDGSLYFFNYFSVTLCTKAWLCRATCHSQF